MKMGWKVHTPSLLTEVLKNPGTEIMAQPLQIFANLLAEVAKRATEIDDPQLNILMMRLTLYEQADPEARSCAEIKAAYDLEERRIEGKSIDHPYPPASASKMWGFINKFGYFVKTEDKTTADAWRSSGFDVRPFYEVRSP